MDPETADSDPSKASGSLGTKQVVLKSPFGRKQDVFDSEDFNPVKLINQLYPDGAVYAGGVAIGLQRRRGDARPAGLRSTAHSRARELAGRTQSLESPPLVVPDETAMAEPCQPYVRRQPAAAARAVACSHLPHACRCTLPMRAEASLGDLDKFMDVLRKQVGLVAVSYAKGGQWACRAGAAPTARCHALRCTPPPPKPQ